MENQGHSLEGFELLPAAWTQSNLYDLRHMIYHTTAGTYNAFQSASLI